MNIDNTNIPFADKVQLPTIRDQFAMAALATLSYAHHNRKPHDDDTMETFATVAYEIADAMLKARAE